MNVHALVLSALAPVLANTWAVELKPNPTWPAAVFDIDSAPEDAWCAGGGYDQHTVNVVVFARDMDELDVLLPQFERALEAVQPAFMGTEDSGDADYEDDSEVYARFLTVRLRTPRY